MTPFTIGYEGLSIDRFLSLLTERKPGFSKTALASMLKFSALEYVYMVNLACPKRVRNRYRELSRR